MMKEPILLIDDDVDDQEIIKEALLPLKVSNPIICFENGFTALNFLKETKQQTFLIICDINMPVMDGISLKKAITQDESLHKKSIPFVFLTTTATEKAVEDAYKMSVQGFFEKTGSFDELRKLVKKIYEYWDTCRHPNNFKQFFKE